MNIKSKWQILIRKVSRLDLFGEISELDTDVLQRSSRVVDPFFPFHHLLSSRELSGFPVKRDFLSASSPVSLQEGTRKVVHKKTASPGLSTRGSHTLWLLLIDQVGLAALFAGSKAAKQTRDQGVLGLVELFVTDKAIHF